MKGKLLVVVKVVIKAAIAAYGLLCLVASADALSALVPAVIAGVYGLGFYIFLLVFIIFWNGILLAPCAIYSLKTGKRIPRKMLIGLVAVSLLPAVVHFVWQLPHYYNPGLAWGILAAGFYLPVALNVVLFVYLGPTFEGASVSPDAMDVGSE